MNAQSIVMEVIANFVFQAVTLVVLATLAVIAVALVGWPVWTAISMTVGTDDDGDMTTDRA